MAAAHRRPLLGKAEPQREVLNVSVVPKVRVAQPGPMAAPWWGCPEPLVQHQGWWPCLGLPGHQCPSYSGNARVPHNAKCFLHLLWLTADCKWWRETPVRELTYFRVRGTSFLDNKFKVSIFYNLSHEDLSSSLILPVSCYQPTYVLSLLSSSHHELSATALSSSVSFTMFLSINSPCPKNTLCKSNKNMKAELSKIRV